MSRLYQYANSSSESGLYLLDGFKGNHTTFQVTPIAERLLRHLDYEPGVRNQERGPRIPDELHWGLFEVGWVYTKSSDVTPPTNEAGEIVVEKDGVELTKQVADDLKLFFEQTDDVDDEIDELAEILSLDVHINTAERTISPSTPTTQEHIWDIPESRFQDIEEQIKTDVREDRKSEDGASWIINNIEAEISEFDDIEKGVITIETERTHSRKEYLHIAYFCPVHGFERVVTVADEEINWKKRMDLEQHRQEVISSVITATTEENIHLGDSTAELNLRTESDPPLFN